MMFQSNTQKSQQGIALIMVLGFLAVLSILAVSFAITMRTERLASSVYVDGVKARQLLYVAMTRAVDEIDYELVTSGNVMPTDADGQKVIWSTGGPVVSNFLYAGEATNYIPAAAVSSLDDARWVTIDDPDGNPAGRIAFAAFDISGLVDINGVVDQFNETNLHAAAFSALPDAPEIASFSTITSEWVRFESTGEIDQSGILSGSQYPRNFTVYSRFETNAFPLFNIQGDENYLQTEQATVLARFTDAGIPAAVHNELFDNLIDYVDTGGVPQDLNSCCTEAVPMINEIIISNVVNVVAPPGGMGPNQLQQTVWLTVETAYPFPAANAVNGQFFVRVNDLNYTITPPPNFPQPYPTAVFPMNGNGFDPSDFSFEVAANSFNIGTITAPFSPGPPMNMTINSVDIEVIDPNGDVVDQVTAVGQWSATPLAVPPAPPGGPYYLYRYSSVTDPRLNYDGAQWINTPITWADVNANANANEGWSTMYVRNGPIENVAELGFLSLGTGPWETVRLYDDGAGGAIHRVLDYFMVSNTAHARGGCINMNSSNTNIIGSLLNDCAIQLYPGEDPPSGGTVTEVQGHGFGNAFVGLPGQGQFQLSSVIGDGNWFQVAFATDAEREMIIHNRHDLFRWRQNLYAVIIAAQSGKDRNSDGDIEENEVTGESRAFFILWRDPVATEHPAPHIAPTAVNKSFIRFFRYLY